MRKKILHSLATSGNVIRTLLIGVLILATASISSAQTLVPSIEIQPGASVEVGEEVYLSATRTTYPDATILGKARYEWDFGDGYYHRFDPVNTSMTRSGIAVTHYYMNPGAFTVTLKVTVWSDFTAEGIPIGNALAINTTTSVIYVAGEAPMAGFEIQRAPFHNRLAQYLYVQIPAAYQRNETVLRVTLKGAKGSSSTLLSKSNLAAEERVFLDHKPLAQDNYVVIAELLNAGGTRISGGLWRDKFSKRYSGIPKVGIDENNSFRVNGELFFPISTFMTDRSRIGTYQSNANLNSLNTMGYYGQEQGGYTPSTWANYLRIANDSGLMVIGPGRGDYVIPNVSAALNYWKFNHNPDRMAEFVNAGKDSPAMFAWIWHDEPNMGGRNSKAYPPTLAAWSYISHNTDPNHPAYNLFIGYDWTKYYNTNLGQLRDYDYLNSAKFFGGKKWMQDVFSYDIYPLQFRLHTTMNFSDMGPYAAWLDAMDRIRANNASQVGRNGLVPLIPAQCPNQIRDTYTGIRTPTEQQVYMESWLNVIHGAKGLLWWQYFVTDTIRWAAMKKFADQMEVLAPAVLGPVTSRTVADSANTALNRVDTMIREKDGVVYVFAARVTEPDPMEGDKYTGVEPASITVSFKISGLTGSAAAAVVDEGRTIYLSDGKFTDTFAKNAVHIYEIGGAGVTASSTTLKRPAPRNLRAKKK